MSVLIDRNSCGICLGVGGHNMLHSDGDLSNSNFIDVAHKIIEAVKDKT